jgi:hypothetical protein
MVQFIQVNDMIHSKYSFKLISRSKLGSSPVAGSVKTNSKEVQNEDKRAFLKIASIAGLGLAASQLLPKKAEALIMGSTPSSSVVGMKNSDNNRVNPATEDTLALIKNTDGIKKITDPLPAGTNTIGNVSLSDITILLKSLLNIITNPSYVDKSANQMRVQATISSGTVTTVTTCATLTNFNSYNANQVVQQANVGNWSLACRSRIS